MKNKKVWITIAVIAVIIIVLVWGSKTNWWGMGKQGTTTTAPGSRVFNNANTAASTLPSGAKYTFSGYGNPTNTGWCRGASDLIIGPNPDGTYSCYKQTA